MSHETSDEPTTGAVFVMTNDASSNQVLAYRRDDEGQLQLDDTYATGGRGTGQAMLSSQGSLVLTQDLRFLLVADPGSDEVSVFRVRGAALELLGVHASGGSSPDSIAVDGDLVYVLNTGDGGTGDVSGFRLGQEDGHLTPITDSQRPLSAAGSGAAQVAISPDGRTLVVTEEATSRILTWPLDAAGRPGPLTACDSAGTTPFGASFTRDGTLVVANAEQGRPGRASASSYALEGSDAGGSDGLRTISGEVGDLRSAACWVTIGADQQHAYVSNFGDGTISSCTIAPDGSLSLLESVAGTTSPGQPSVRDAGTTRDGRYLYAIDVTSRHVHGWSVGDDAGLTPVGTFPGLPSTAAGIATA